MAVIEIKGVDELLRGLSNLQKEQLPIMMANTLTQTAYIARNKVVAEMQTVFDRPTSFTLDSMNVVEATKTRWQSKVTPKSSSRINPEQHYLNPQVEGGRRWFKKAEARLYKKGILPAGYFTVPGGGADMDEFGNMARSQLIQLLAYFDAFGEAGFRSNMNDAGRKRLLKGTKKKYGVAYFVIKPGTRSHLHPGIYKRTNLVSGANVGPAAPIRPILIFVRNATYKKRLDIERIANETYDRYFEMNFRGNLKHAINTAFPR